MHRGRRYGGRGRIACSMRAGNAMMGKFTFTHQTSETVMSSKRAPQSSRVAFGCATAVLFLISGCASVSSVQSGTPIDDVVQKFGRPSITCSQPDGSRRMVWTQQPEGETAYALIVGTDNKVSAPRQILNDGQFAILGNGQKWTPEAIRCEFGPPANMTEDGIGHARQWVWGYRYMRGSDPLMMYIYMGKDGKQMTRFGAAPDPDRNEEVMGGRR